MIINIVVHDLFNEIGHSRAMLEVINAMDENFISQVNVISFTHASKEELFPNKKFKVTFSDVPFNIPKPLLLKSIYFQFYTQLFKEKLIVKSNAVENKHKTITVGVCSFIGDVVNVQFVHRLWSPIYFKINKVSPFKYIHKKLLFNYLNACEDYYYRIKKPKIVSLSKFIADDLKKRYHYDDEQITTAYSSASLETFSLDKRSRKQQLDDLKEKYQCLKSLDINKPILLFVGAFERKGLPIILENLGNKQLIIIGKPESGKSINFPSNIFYIPFTKEIECFFNLADCFVFPTEYEPFGLVVIEAAATGMKLIITKDNVGASELLENTEDVEFCTSSNIAKLIDETQILSAENRQQNVNDRKKLFDRYSWQEAANHWEKILISS